MRKAEQQAGVPRATAQHDPEKLAQNYIGTTTASRRPIPSEAQYYLIYARVALQFAEAAGRANEREKLLELSRVWMEAALQEERRVLHGRASRRLKGS
jgi:hypothetical protein